MLSLAAPKRKKKEKEEEKGGRKSDSRWKTFLQLLNNK
jgi:hypothetical protein